ncbi:MAG: hypothetical protein RRY55_04230 [Bacteroidales bacterium]
MILISTVSCSKVNEDRIPLATVRIEISKAQQAKRDWWVTAPAEHVEFIKPSYPIGFSYTISSYTGYGGVMLVYGYDDVRYAFDLTCPVEREASVKIYIDANYDACCRRCGSTFDVFWGSGAPKTGEAADRQYALRKYYVSYVAGNGSYMIVNY